MLGEQSASTSSEVIAAHKDKEEFVIGFLITNLITDEQEFPVNGALGEWKFQASHNYSDLVNPITQQGVCGNTFTASLDEVSNRSSDSDFSQCCDEIIDISLILSFLQARCITPSGTTNFSDIQFVQLGDDFIPQRGIVGFPELKPVSGYADIFSSWSTGDHQEFISKRLRLFLAHYLSGLTCFTLEDLFLSLGVQMDLVKQEERRLTGNSNLTYRQGMESASSRYEINPLSIDYNKMRNDIVHEGVLSGENFTNKTKSECAKVVVDTLNWIDSYILSALSLTSKLNIEQRWKTRDMEHGLPSISVR